MGRFKWSVVGVVPHEDYTMTVEFHDGTRGTYDVRPLLGWEVYEPLNSLPFFMGARAERGTVVWGDDIDIAPERLYEDCAPLPEAS